MNSLQRARWQLAVLVELAQPGCMQLAAVLDESRDVLDFTWLKATTTSSRALGCAGENLVGRSLKQVLAEFGIPPSILAACRSAFLAQCSRMEHVAGKDGIALHQISASQWGVTIKVTDLAAVERVLSAQRVLSQLESSERYSRPGGSLLACTPWSPSR